MRRPRDGQRGFALLLVFAMAAMVAIFLYMQLPRVAFEAQRDREDLLIQRGEEYKRAIELYVRKNNRYPQDLRDLERDQDVRYLRRRYKDPLTDSGEWRIIRINAAGQLEGSLVQKAKPGEQANPQEEQVAENTAMRQREGDQTAANAQFPGGGGGAGPLPQGQNQNAPGNPLDDGLVPMVDASGNVIQRTKTEAEAQAQQAGAQGLPGATPGNGPQPPGTPGSQQGQQEPLLGPGGIPIITNPAEAVAAAGNARGTPQGSRASSPAAAFGGASGTAPTRGSSAQGNRTATDVIGGLLTTPVPGGLEGLQQRRGIGASAAAGAQGLGAGIAGVASKLEMRGIKVYDEQDSIHKWEFVFDARKKAAQAMEAQQQHGGAGQGTGGLGMSPSGFGSSGAGGRTGRQPSFGGSGGGGRPGQGSSPFPTPGSPQRPR